MDRSMDLRPSQGFLDGIEIGMGAGSDTYRSHSARRRDGADGARRLPESLPEHVRERSKCTEGKEKTIATGLQLDGEENGQRLLMSLRCEKRDFFGAASGLEGGESGWGPSSPAWPIRDKSVLSREVVWPRVTGCPCGSDIEHMEVLALLLSRAASPHDEIREGLQASRDFAPGIARFRSRHHNSGS